MWFEDRPRIRRTCIHMYVFYSWMDSYESCLKPYICTCVTIGNPCVFLHSPSCQRTKIIVYFVSCICVGNKKQFGQALSSCPWLLYVRMYCTYRTAKGCGKRWRLTRDSIPSRPSGLTTTVSSYCGGLFQCCNMFLGGHELGWQLYTSVLTLAN